MKSFLAFALVAFATVTSLFAQAEKMPTLQDVPTLQEWWRADNKGYGKYGMTWLDNFYDNKGAFVVYTPSGVKTWRLNSPGDTQNVFTWPKGSANIKIGDFNGDKLVDYVDENCNIYEGIGNGEPPKSESVAPVGHFYPWLIADINNDGYDDIIHPAASYPRVMQVIFGKSALNEMKVLTVPLPALDSNNEPVAAYMVAPKEMRVVCRRFFWHYNKQEQIIDRDGYRLVRVWWDGSGFQSQILDEFMVNAQDGTGLYWKGALMQQPNGKIYWLGVSLIQGHIGENILSIYNLTEDRLQKTDSIRADRISGLRAIGTLKYSINNETQPTWFLCRYDNNDLPVFHFYSGNITDSLHEIGQFTTVQVSDITSIPDVTGDGRADIALSNYYIVSTFERTRFAVLSLQDSVMSAVGNSEYRSFDIESVSPLPVRKSEILRAKIRLAVQGKYVLALYDYYGKQVSAIPLKEQEQGEYTISLNLADFLLSAGTYTLRLESNKILAQCLIILE